MDGLQQSGFNLEPVFNSHSLLLRVLHMFYPTGKRLASELHDPNSPCLTECPYNEEGVQVPVSLVLESQVKENLFQQVEERDHSPLSGTS